MSDQLDEAFKRFNLDTSEYSIGKVTQKLRDISVAELEELQDKEAEYTELADKLMPATEVLKKERAFQEFVLKLAFGKTVNINNIKKSLSASEYRIMFGEVLFFLGRFSSIDAVNEFIAISKEKKASLEKMIES